MTTKTDVTKEKQETASINTGLAEALKGITDVLQRQQDANTDREAGLIGQAMKEATKPRENASPPRISSRNPQGDKDFPRPKLNFEKVFVPYEGEPEQFTTEEIELLNLLTPGEYWITLNDGSRQVVAIEVTRNSINGRPEKLFMHSALFSVENKTRARPFREMLREILGDEAKDVLTMDEQHAQILAGTMPVSIGE